MNARRWGGLALSILLSGCARPHAPTGREASGATSVPVTASAPIETSLPSDAGPPSPIATALEIPVNRECTTLKVTRHIPKLKEDTFMLRPETTTRLDLAALPAGLQADAPWKPGHRVPSGEKAFARVFDRWLGDGKIETRVTFTGFDGKTVARFAFGAHAHLVDYATCDLDDTRGIIAIALTSNGAVQEDVCNAKTGGATRDRIADFTTSYTGGLSHECAD